MKGLGLLFILTLTFQISFGQQKTIYGKVTSEFEGRPIKRVKVILVDSKIKTRTSDKGMYSITIPDSGQKLLFIKRRHTAAEVEIGPNTELNVSLTTPVRFGQSK